MRCLLWIVSCALCPVRVAGTVAAYMYWLFNEGDLEFAMSGLRNARLLQVVIAQPVAFCIRCTRLFICTFGVAGVCRCWSVFWCGRVQVMWAMQLHQLSVVIVSPAFFGMALYEAVMHIILRWPTYVCGSRAHSACRKGSSGAVPCSTIQRVVSRCC